MVLGVGLEVVDVDGGQAGDEQLQLLLREDGDEPLGDDLIETLQEGGQLLTDGTWREGGVTPLGSNRFTERTILHCFLQSVRQLTLSIGLILKPLSMCDTGWVLRAPLATLM